MPNDVVKIQVPDNFRRAAEGVIDLVLADLALIGETPAPTAREEKRAEFLLQRFADNGYINCQIDALGTVSGVLPGDKEGSAIIVAANLDTIVEDVRDQTVEIREDRAIGPFVGDSSIALAALTTLPLLLEKASLRLKSPIHVVAAARSLGRGNLEGIRAHLAARPGAYTAGLCLENVQLGRLNYGCMGMMRGEITARLPETYDWEQYGATGSIMPMAEVVNRISRIPIPSRPLTNMIIGSISGGFTYNNLARETRLRFEVRSESSDNIKQLTQQIDDIAEDVSAQSGVNMKFEVVAQREPGALDISHPLVRAARAILTSLDVQPQLYMTTSLMAALVDAKIPALTLGMTHSQRRSELDEIDESVEIKPIATGLTQVVALLDAIDRGLPNGTT